MLVQTSWNIRAWGSKAYTAPVGPVAAARKTVKSPMLAPAGSSNSTTELQAQAVQPRVDGCRKLVGLAPWSNHAKEYWVHMKALLMPEKQVPSALTTLP